MHLYSKEDLFQILKTYFSVNEINGEIFVLRGEINLALINEEEKKAIDLLYRYFSLNDFITDIEEQFLFEILNGWKKEKSYFSSSFEETAFYRLLNKEAINEKNAFVFFYKITNFVKKVELPKLDLTNAISGIKSFIKEKVNGKKNVCHLEEKWLKHYSQKADKINLIDYVCDQKYHKDFQRSNNFLINYAQDFLTLNPSFETRVKVLEIFDENVVKNPNLFLIQLFNTLFSQQEIFDLVQKQDKKIKLKQVKIIGNEYTPLCYKKDFFNLLSEEHRSEFLPEENLVIFNCLAKIIGSYNLNCLKQSKIFKPYIDLLLSLNWIEEIETKTITINVKKANQAVEKISNSALVNKEQSLIYFCLKNAKVEKVKILKRGSYVDLPSLFPSLFRKATATAPCFLNFKIFNKATEYKEEISREDYLTLLKSLVQGELKRKAIWEDFEEKSSLSVEMIKNPIPYIFSLPLEKLKLFANAIADAFRLYDRDFVFFALVNAKYNWLSLLNKNNTRSSRKYLFESIQEQVKSPMDLPLYFYLISKAEEFDYLKENKPIAILVNQLLIQQNVDRFNFSQEYIFRKNANHLEVKNFEEVLNKDFLINECQNWQQVETSNEKLSNLLYSNKKFQEVLTKVKDKRQFAIVFDDLQKKAISNLKIFKGEKFCDSFCTLAENLFVSPIIDYQKQTVEIELESVDEKEAEKILSMPFPLSQKDFVKSITDRYIPVFRKIDYLKAKLYIEEMPMDKVKFGKLINQYCEALINKHSLPLMKRKEDLRDKISKILNIKSAEIFYELFLKSRAYKEKFIRLNELSQSEIMVFLNHYFEGYFYYDLDFEKEFYPFLFKSLEEKNKDGLNTEEMNFIFSDFIKGYFSETMMKYRKYLKTPAERFYYALLKKILREEFKEMSDLEIHTLLSGGFWRGEKHTSIKERVNEIEKDLQELLLS